MHSNTITLNKIISPINRKRFKKYVDKYGGDIGTKGFTCWHQFISILFGQLSDCQSLRGIESALNYNSQSHYHLGLRLKISKSTISYANKTRDWRIYRDLFFDLIRDLKQKDMIESKNVITLLDSSPISLIGKGHQWAESTMRTTGLKLHIAYNLNSSIPVYFDITGARTNDITIGKETQITGGSTYVFDKGYTDYNWWKSIDEQGAYFVTRLKSNAKITYIRDNPSSGNILRDSIIKLSVRKPRGGKINNYHNQNVRIVVVNRVDKATPLTLITNNFMLTSEEISNLYKQRWQVELFFKWIKQNLKIKKFLAQNENAIKTQICIALISFVLLKIANILQTVCSKISMRNLIVIVKNSMFVRHSLKNKTKIFNSKQMTFCFINSS